MEKTNWNKCIVIRFRHQSKRMNKTIALVFLVLIFSCKEKSGPGKIATELKAFYGQTIRFPEELKSVSDRIPDFKDYNCQRSYKIIAYVDSAACTPCTLQTFTLWKNFTDKLEKADAELILVLKSEKDREIRDILAHHDILFPVFIDREGKFKVINRLPESALLHTFLLDKTNHVAFAGSPIQNEKSWLLFQKVIAQLDGNQGILP